MTKPSGTTTDATVPVEEALFAVYELRLSSTDKWPMSGTPGPAVIWVGISPFVDIVATISCRECWNSTIVLRKKDLEAGTVPKAAFEAIRRQLCGGCYAKARRTELILGGQ